MSIKLLQLLSQTYLCPKTLLTSRFFDLESTMQSRYEDSDRDRPQRFKKCSDRKQKMLLDNEMNSHEIV